MKPLRSLLLLSSLVLPHLALAQAPGAAPTAATTTPTAPTQPTDIPAPKIDARTGQPQAAFMAAHERYVGIAKEGKAQLVFLGDSITAGWAGAGKEAWAKTFSQYQPANFGIGGDRTQHVLWRITNGELDGLTPKAVVIMIGTNNASTSGAPEIAKGVTKIVETVRAKVPAAKILLLGIFPRGEKPTGQLGAMNAKLTEVNATIAGLADGQHVHFLDIGAKFTQGKDVLDKAIMPDFLHLSPAGYQIWAEAISPKLAELMK